MQLGTLITNYNKLAQTDGMLIRTIRMPLPKLISCSLRGLTLFFYELIPEPEVWELIKRLVAHAREALKCAVLIFYFPLVSFFIILLSFLRERELDFKRDLYHQRAQYIQI